MKNFILLPFRRLNFEQCSESFHVFAVRFYFFVNCCLCSRLTDFLKIVGHSNELIRAIITWISLINPNQSRYKPAHTVRFSYMKFNDQAEPILGVWSRIVVTPGRREVTRKGDWAGGLDQDMFVRGWGYFVSCLGCSLSSVFTLWKFVEL